MKNENPARRHVQVHNVLRFIPCMKTPLRLLLALLFSQVAMVAPCRATEIVTVYDSFKKDTLLAPNPEYPMKSQHLGYQGQGIYRLIVNQNTGVVDEVKILKTTGHRELDAGAVLTFFNWKFKPGAVNHRDVLVIFHMTGWTRGLH